MGSSCESHQEKATRRGYAVIVISIDVKKVMVCAGVPRQRGHLNALECLNEPLKPLQGNKGEKGGLGQGEIWRFSLLLLHLLQLGGLGNGPINVRITNGSPALSILITVVDAICFC
ncbi:hypothetical protein Tco_1123478 [Tanacetum coccineum]|uniref:Uncharacterized protein n=1 Tax=Tanacetum coccineum TaxID=301880 RepID=A0ABQ5J674_9ASTR